MMNPRENALRTITFDRPEYVQMSCPMHHLAYLGCNHQGYEGGGHHLPLGSKWTDIWGTGWVLEHAGVMGFPRGNPLADLPRDLATFQWPDPDDERLLAPLDDLMEKWDRENKFLAAFHRDTLWEKSYMLVGMENIMCYFRTDPEAARELLHGIMNFQLGMARHYMDRGVEMALLGDDLGTQRGLLLPPDIIHEFLVPEYRRLFDFYNAHQVTVMFHSCGHIEPIVELLLDLGVRVLNPVQATANNLDAIRRITHGRAAIEGGISSDILMRGPVERIRDEVRKRLWQLGRDGGYFCAPDQGLPWPKEHIDAYFQAVSEFGQYPLLPPDDEA